MTIEFADPGFNWAFVWWPIAILLVAISAFVITSKTKYVNWDMGHSLRRPLLGGNADRRIFLGLPH